MSCYAACKVGIGSGVFLRLCYVILYMLRTILNVINILVNINSASNNTSSASVMLCCVIVHSVI